LAGTTLESRRIARAVGADDWSGGSAEKRGAAARPGGPAAGADRGRPRLSHRLPRGGTWLALFLAALGPGVIGLVADNDAGGMLSYFVTGTRGGLEWILPALLLLEVPSFFVMRLALRVAQTTGLPYSKVLIRAVGRPLTLVEAVALYALNVLILVTEFVGMSLALSLAGLPLPASLGATFALVVAITGFRIYPRIEKLLLRTALISLAFIPALLLLHPSPGAAAAALAATGASPWFLLMALAGNMLAPWMVYWEQNAVWAGKARTPRQQTVDLATGVVAQTVMAAVAILLGALTPGHMSVAASPLAWLYRHGGRLPGVLFAVGIFDAGLLAAATISLSSLWTLREAVGHGASDPSQAPNRGLWLVVHVATLALAAGIVLAPHLAAGPVALWAQALTAVWMPVTLVLLWLVSRSRRIMGRHAATARTQVALLAIAAGFAAVTVLGLAGR
jgi:Mn2+/Fe2+ NRAMP family transporter